MPPAPATPRRATASHPLLPVLPALPALPPWVTGAVNICTGPDKEKANRVPLFMGLGSRLLGQLHSISVLSAPQLGLSPCCTPRPCRLLRAVLPPRWGEVGNRRVGSKGAGQGCEAKGREDRQ